MSGDELRKPGSSVCFNARLHFPCGFVGESDGENLPGRNAGFFDQMDDAASDDASLTRARSGENQKRPLGRFDGFLLLGIEIFH